MTLRSRGSMVATFQTKTEPLPWTGCLIWTGATKSGGYGAIWDGERTVGAHRYAWEGANGPIPEGMVVDHLCWTPLCCEVTHLRLTTQAENTRNRRPGRKSKSGTRNVYWSETRRAWFVQVMHDGVFHYGGSFPKDQLAEAEQSAIALRGRLFGDHSGDH